MLHLQALLSNARQASSGSQNSSSSSCNTSSTDEDSQQATPTGSPAKPDLTPVPIAAATATYVSTAAASQPNTAGSGVHTDAGVSAGRPTNASLTETDTGRLNADRSTITSAGGIAASRAACLPNIPASIQTSFPTGDEPGTASQVSYWGTLLGLLQALRSTIMAQLPKQVCKLMQPAGWYRLTHAANMCTGQTLAPQAWWRLDSWLTAPAETQYQRCTFCLCYCMGANTAAFTTEPLSICTCLLSPGQARLG